MLGINAIHRLIDAERYSEVIEGCLRSSMPLPLSIRLQLASGGNERIGAVALGLGRVLDLSYRITDNATALARELLSHQRDDGGFGQKVCPALTVQALASLAALRERLARDPLFDRLNGGHPGSLAGLDSAIARACGHLSEKSCVSTEHMVHDRETTAYLLVVMARHPTLRDYLDAGTIERDLLEAGCQHDRASSRLFDHARRLMQASMLETARAPTAA